MHLLGQYSLVSATSSESPRSRNENKLPGIDIICSKTGLSYVSSPTYQPQVEILLLMGSYLACKTVQFQVYCRIRPLGDNEEESCVQIISDTVLQLTAPKVFSLLVFPCNIALEKNMTTCHVLIKLCYSGCSLFIIMIHL